MLKLKENSPARLLNIFPPHMELDELKRKGNVRVAAIPGPGKGQRIRRIIEYAAIGNSKIPEIDPSLKATCNDITPLSRVIIRKLSGK